MPPFLFESYRYEKSILHHILRTVDPNHPYWKPWFVNFLKREHPLIFNGTIASSVSIASFDTIASSLGIATLEEEEKVFESNAY